MPQIGSGIDIGSMFSSAIDGLDRDGSAIQKQLDSLSRSDQIDQKDLLRLQFAMGQYNAKLETISSVTKSLQDMLKSLAQRTG